MAETASWLQPNSKAERKEPEKRFSTATSYVRLTTFSELRGALDFKNYRGFLRQQL
jgi:hypothetical protein